MGDDVRHCPTCHTPSSALAKIAEAVARIATLECQLAAERERRHCGCIICTCESCDDSECCEPGTPGRCHGCGACECEYHQKIRLAGDKAEAELAESKKLHKESQLLNRVKTEHINKLEAELAGIQQTNIALLAELTQYRERYPVLEAELARLQGVVVYIYNEMADVVPCDRGTLPMRTRRQIGERCDIDALVAALEEKDAD